MRYIRWIWTNMAGIRWNTAIRIITGITQVLLGLLMIWLSKQFIDITIRVGCSAVRCMKTNCIQVMWPRD